MILSFINIRKVPRENVENLGLRPRVLKHFPRNYANVNEWKIMFDPSTEIIVS